ncbi:MAG: hypothetical protein MR557_02375, partial [Faecalibacterium sp.]|nr:hypothetical protein [Faecalibacterium sp.]
ENALRWFLLPCPWRLPLSGWFPVMIAQLRQNARPCAGRFARRRGRAAFSFEKEGKKGLTSVS